MRKLYLAGRIWSLLCLCPIALLVPVGASAQCPQLELVFIDGCGVEQHSEFVVFTSGGGFAVSSFGFDYDVNNNGTLGSGNDDMLNGGQCEVSSVQNPFFPIVIGGCSFTFVGPGDMVPANSRVVFLTSFENDGSAYDFAPICQNGEEIYVILNDCVRGIGAFTNFGAPANRTSVLSAGGCSVPFTYDRNDLVGSAGDYLLFDGTGNFTPGNLACALPPLPALCTPPTAPATTPELTACINPGNGVATWTPADADPQFDPGGAAGYTISYHPDQNSADNDAAPITGIFSATSDQTIYARVEDGADPTCFTLVEVSLVAIDAPFPGTDGTVGPFCSGTIAAVDLVGILNSGTPPDGGGTWTDDDGAGVNLGNPSAVIFNGQPPGDYGFTYTIPAANGCPAVSATATVTIGNGPVANVPTDPLVVCYSFSPSFGYDADFATIENQITGGTGAPVVYYREPGATTEIDPDNVTINDMLFLLGLPDPPTVYARIEPGGGCPSVTVPVTGLLEEYPNATPAAAGSCDDGSGLGTFDLTSLNAVVNGGSGATVTYYTDAGATNTIVSTAAYPSAGGTIYATVAGPNCASQPVDITLTLSNLAPTITVDNGIDCNGSGTGELTVTTPGNNPADLSYAWTPAALGDTDNLTGLTAGTYSVVVTNTATGCTSSPVSETLGEPAALTSACAVTQDAVTAGGSEGVINLDINGGTAPYTVSWNSPTGGSGSNGGVAAGSFDINGLVAGSYTIDVVDANNCSFSCTDLIIADAGCSLSLTPTIFAINCVDGGDGMIQIDITDGTAPYAIDWTGPVSGSTTGETAASYTIMDLIAGDYTLTVTDDAGCTETITVTLADGAGPAVDIFNCQNLPQPNNGSINSYTFSLAGGNPLSDTEPIYIVEVYDEMGTLVFTFNSTTVGADLVPGTYFFNQPVARGTYTLIAIDEYGCQDICQITVDPTCPYDFVASAVVTPPSCASTASIQINSSNGVLANGGSLSYQWSGGLSGNNPQNVPPGTYSVTVTDFYCDIVLDNIVVPELVELDPLTCSVESEPTTLTSDDGLIRVDWTGGAAPLNLSWTGPNGTSDQYAINSGNTTVFNGLGGAGTYDITLIDANGCEQTCSVTLVGPPCPVAISVCQGQDATAPSADDGAIQIVLTDQVDPWQFTYEGTNIFGNPVSGTITGITGVVGEAFGIPPGIYNITVTDGAGCELTCGPITIEEPPCTIMASATSQPAACNGENTGSIDLTVTGANGAVTYDWNDNNLDGQEDPTGLSAGTYVVNLTDAAGCTLGPLPVTVGEPAALTLTCAATDATTVGGTDGSIALTFAGGTGPFTASWSGPASGSQSNVTSGFAIPDLPAGTYTISLTDANGCTQSCVSAVNEPGCALSASATSQPAACNGDNTGGIDLTVTGANGAVTYDWNDNNLDGQEDPTGLSAGTYVVNLTDAAGCTFGPLPVTVGAPAALTLTCAATDATTVGGIDGSIALTFAGGTGPFTAGWSGPAGGSQSNVTSGFSIPDLPAGTYTVTLTDANGCTQSCVSAVNEPGCALSASATSQPADCFGAATGGIDLTVTGANGAVTYDWNDDSLDGQEDPTGLSAGTYTVNLTDAAGCTFGPLSVIVGEPAALTLTCAATDATTVGGTDGSMALTFAGGTGPFTASWSGPASGSQSNVTSGFAIPDLPAGTYTISLTDANGCTQSCVSAVNEPGCALSASATSQPAACNGDNTGSIDLTVTGANGPVTYDWNDNGLDGQEDPTGLSAGTYVVNLTDAAGCTFGPLPVTVGEPAALALACSATGVATVGGSDGSITLDFSGGLAPFAAVWTGPNSGNASSMSSGFVISNLGAGSYSVTITDANNCIVTCSTQVGEPSCSLSATAMATDPDCFGAANGGITLALAGATDPVTFDWNVDAFDGQQNPGGLTAGTYEVVLTDAVGCTFGPLVTTLTAPNFLDLGCVPADVSTPGGADGRITLLFTGGTGPFSVAWTGAASGSLPSVGTNAVIDNLPPGDYSVVLTDANGCTATCSQTLEEPVCDLTATATTTAVSCFGGTDGLATVTPAGGTPPYTVGWSDPDFDSAQAAAGTYTYTVTDAVGCSAMGSVTIDQPAALTLDCTATPVSTVGGADGVGRITISGGSGPFAIDWSGAAGPLGSEAGFAGTTYDITGLSAGTYQIEVTDANGCERTCGFTINDPGCDLIVTAVAANPTCAGTSDGAIGLTVSGSATPFTFDWNNDNLDGQEDPQGLAPGTYEVTVADANGCTEIRGFTLVAPPALQMTCQSSDETVPGNKDGGISVSFSGGTPPYSLSGDLGDQANASSPLSFADLAPGAYNINLTDANGCVQSCVATVAPGAGCPTIEVDPVITPENCAGDNSGAIEMNPTGGTEPYTIVWSNGQLTGFEPMGLAAATYAYTITDAAGCLATGEVILPAGFDPPGLVCGAATAETSAGANDGAISFEVSSVSPPFQVKLAGSSPRADTYATNAGMYTYSDLSPGGYELTVIDANGCGMACSFTIEAVICELSLLLDPVSPVCYEACVQIPYTFTGVGPYTLDYRYTTASGTVTEQAGFPVAAGTWELCPQALGVVSLSEVSQLELLSITGSNCTVALGTTYPLNVGPPVLAEVTGTYCNDTTILVGNELFDRDRPTGQVVLTGASAQGCDSTIVVDLSYLTPPPPSELTVRLCPGDSTLVLGRIFRSGDDGALIRLPGGAANGCDSLVNVSVFTSTIAEGTVTGDACPGDTVYVAGRPFTVDAPDGIVILPGGASGGCDSLISVVISFAGSEGVTLSGNENMCPGESATLFLSYDGPGTVDVVIVDSTGQTQLVSGVGQNTGFTVTPAQSQRYRIQAVLGGSGSCPPFGRGEARVRVSGLAVVVRASDAGGISCAGAADGILIASATAGIPPYTYQWETGATTASVGGLEEGTYAVTVTDVVGCMGTASGTLVAPPPLVYEIVGLGPDCFTDQGILRIDRVAGGSGRYAFGLDGFNYTSINAFPFSRTVSPGQYEVFIQDSNGCEDRVAVRVPEGDGSELYLPPDTTILMGDSVRLVGLTSLEPDTIIWTPASGFATQNGLSIVANPLATTVYSLEVRDARGCTQRAKVTVFVDREALLYAPTGFSPNEDGRNDLFRLYGGPGVARVETFQIFNRWGELVYQDGPLDPTDPNWGWDGTYRAERLNPAVFVYKAVVTLVDGRRVSFEGDITLLH